MLKVDNLRSYKSESDSFLIDAVKSGDNDAFSELIDRYSEIIDYNLSSFAPRLFRPNNLTGNTERDDLFQECCIVLFKAVKHFDFGFGVKFYTYANACIKNYLISLYRKCAKNNGYILVSLDDGRVAHDLSIDMSAGCLNSEVSYTAEIVDAKILSALTEFEREVCILYLQDGSYKNIAEALGKNIKSIDNAVCRIKSKLKRLSSTRE